MGEGQVLPITQVGWKQLWNEVNLTTKKRGGLVNFRENREEIRRDWKDNKKKKKYGEVLKHQRGGGKEPKGKSRRRRENGRGVTNRKEEDQKKGLTKTRVVRGGGKESLLH